MRRNTRRITAALATTAGALLLTTVGASADLTHTYTVDPVTLGAPTTGSFVTATFNVLGNSHTAGADPRPSGAVRMGYTMQLLRENAVDLVGLQELETKQATAFKSLAGSEYKLYSPPNDTRDSIAWRADRFDLIAADGVSVPYKENWRTMPVVLLRDKTTRKQFWVMSVHNVAGSEATFVKRRAISLRNELDKIKALRAKRHVPVLFLGDFNDRSESFYCQMLSSRFTSSSVWWTTPLCALPSRAGIDWIFGTGTALRFTGYVKQDGGLVDLASDHPLVLARVVR